MTNYKGQMTNQVQNPNNKNNPQGKTRGLIECTIILFLFSCSVYGLSPHEILIVANSKNVDSVKIAKYYSYKRNVPAENILEVDLKAPLRDSIGRTDYNKLIAAPLREKINSSKDKIRCIVLTYGVPYKLGGKIITLEEKQQIGVLQKNADVIIKDLRPLVHQLDVIIDSKTPMSKSAFRVDRIMKTINSKLKQAEKKINKMPSGIVKDSNLRILNKAKTSLQNLNASVAQLNTINRNLDMLKGKETNASVDSELSLVMYGDYNLYRYQPNNLKGDGFDKDSKTVMIARLDGPSAG